MPGLAHGQVVDAAPTVMREAIAFFNEVSPERLDNQKDDR